MSLNSHSHPFIFLWFCGDGWECKDMLLWERCALCAPGNGCQTVVTDGRVRSHFSFLTILVTIVWLISSGRGESLSRSAVSFVSCLFLIPPRTFLDHSCGRDGKSNEETKANADAGYTFSGPNYKFVISLLLVIVGTENVCTSCRSSDSVTAGLSTHARVHIRLSFTPFICLSMSAPAVLNKYLIATLTISRLTLRRAMSLDFVSTHCGASTLRFYASHACATKCVMIQSLIASLTMKSYHCVAFLFSLWLKHGC